VQRLPLGHSQDAALSRNQVQQAVDELLAAEVAWRQAKLGTSPALSDAQLDLVLELQALPLDTPLSAVNRERVVEAARNLITATGRHSGLLVDPELDSYYTMSLVVLRYPELLALIHDAGYKTVESSRVRGKHAGGMPMLTDLLVLEAKLAAAAKAARSDLDEALMVGSPVLAAQLEPSRVPLEQSQPAELRCMGCCKSVSIDCTTALFRNWRQ
jgi:hypothetical protein